MNKLYQIYFYVPVEYKEVVKEAMFLAGGGRFKHYDQCAFEYHGTGQFRALEGAKPFIGKEDEKELVEEIKIEMICEGVNLKNVITSLKSTHPYEEVAYGVIELVEV
jgi:hypothetical protein